MTELAYVAFVVTSTHMSGAGFSSLMRKALAAGAIPAQVIQTRGNHGARVVRLLETTLGQTHELAADMAVTTLPTQ